jgi:hypothetical protein
LSGDWDSSKDKRDREPSARRGGKAGSNVQSLVTGLVLGGGFMAYWAFGGHHSWAIIAALFAGLLPAARGLSGMITSRASAPAAKKVGDRERAAENEKAVLRMARDRGGRLTPSLVALDCDLGVSEAELVLDGLARKGHASMKVRDDGRIEYEFSEFLKAIEDR